MRMDERHAQQIEGYLYSLSQRAQRQAKVVAALA